MPSPPLMVVMCIIIINSCTIHIFTAEASTVYIAQESGQTRPQDCAQLSLRCKRS
ncbi:hypothetical protein FocTR4_00005800 [Fusarium oxysporum f. sp. cubense]|uniref:Uncharacterized protein n=1 Tax=Fusarium oxysporum f. sp. cubense TaxID=61366 RepID=A0A5C6TK60_FUSOC|nr:hypothetical protein FocTR4_00005800 [Fusarium oxysporum f. sp. cubense]